MISELVQQMDGCGGGEGGLTNTNFYPTTFKVQDFTLLYFFCYYTPCSKPFFSLFNTSVCFFCKIKNIRLFAIRFQNTLEKSLLHVTHCKLVHDFLCFF